MPDLNLPKNRKMISRAIVWKRFAAISIDLIILYIFVIAPLNIPVSMQLQESIPDDLSFMEMVNYLQEHEVVQSTGNVIRSLTMFMLMYLYFVIFELKLRQTPGKMFFNLYVISADDKEFNLPKSLIRNLRFAPLGFIVFVAWIVDFFNIIITKRRFLDVLSKTDVIEEISI